MDGARANTGLVLGAPGSHAALLRGVDLMAAIIQMTGAVIAALPTVVVYLALGRLIMRGLLAGAVKG